MMISTKKLRISMMKWIYTILIKKKACRSDGLIESFFSRILLGVKKTYARGFISKFGIM